MKKLIQKLLTLSNNVHHFPMKNSKKIMKPEIPYQKQATTSKGYFHISYRGKTWQ